MQREARIFHGKMLSPSRGRFDDSGMKETGKDQFTTSLGFDRVFNANDVLYISNTLDTSRDWSEKGTRSQSFSYSIPCGKNRLTISHSRNWYNQLVFSKPYDFTSPESRKRAV